MKFSTSREAILKPLQLVSGVVEKRQTLPILANVLIKLDENGLTVTATDLETEVIVHGQVDQVMPGEITVPLRKLQDTCKTLKDEDSINFTIDGEKAIIKSGKTRFTLTTMPASDFPVVDIGSRKHAFSIAQKTLKYLIEKTHFAMAVQDVRYYLNGMLLEIDGNSIKAVATDGHRLAYCEAQTDQDLSSEKIQAIVQRKGVLELARLMEDSDELVEVEIGDNFLRLNMDGVSFTTKLVDGKYPSYQNVIPSNGDKWLMANKEELRACLVRTSILSNEKYRGIRLELENNILKAQANNPEQEEAEDEINVELDGGPLTIGFNVNYLLDAVNNVNSETIKMTFTDTNGSVLINSDQEDGCKYVVMPMRL